MTTLAERTVSIVQGRLSRRGFLALCGKLTLALGTAMLGVAGTAREVLGACCPTPSCDTAYTYPCPPTHCPTGCQTGNPTQCCDASNRWHICWPCICPGVVCYCEEVTPDPC